MAASRPLKPVSECLEIIQRSVPGPLSSESVPLRRALGRYLVEPVAAVASVATTCPEPVVEDKSTSGAAVAAPLAVAAVLAAVFV